MLSLPYRLRQQSSLMTEVSIGPLNHILVHLALGLRDGNLLHHVVDPFVQYGLLGLKIGLHLSYVIQTLLRRLIVLLLQAEDLRRVLRLALLQLVQLALCPVH